MRGEHDRPGATHGREHDRLAARMSAFAHIGLDLIDENDGVAHVHAGERDQAEQSDEAERAMGEVERDRRADDAERRGEEDDRQPREALQLDHQQRQHDDDHDREQGEDRDVALLRFLDRPAHLDAIAGLQAVADRRELLPQRRRNVGRLRAVDDVGDAR